MLSGVLRVDKPAGPTSFDVVAAVGRAVGQRKLGHGGTLDPPATGLLLLLFGAARRLQEYVTRWDKTYTFSLVLGLATDTLDTAGDPVARVEVGLVPVDEVVGAAREMVGEVELVPPMVSALHHRGRRLYEIAREGGQVPREPRRCRIAELALVGPAERGEDGLLRFPMRISCSSGTYVRSVGDAIARRLGVPGCISDLRRTRIGGYTLEGALTLDEAVAGGCARVASELLTPDTIVAHLPRLELDAAQAGMFVEGRAVKAALEGEGEVSVFGPRGFLGIGIASAVGVRPRRVLANRGPASG